MKSSGSARSFCLQTRSVGVTGDKRTYGQPDRAASRHFRGRHERGLGTACPTTFWILFSTKITDNVEEVNRVVLDVTRSPGHHRVGVNDC